MVRERTDGRRLGSKPGEPMQGALRRGALRSAVQPRSHRSDGGMQSGLGRISGCGHLRGQCRLIAHHRTVLGKPTSGTASAPSASIFTCLSGGCALSPYCRTATGSDRRRIRRFLLASVRVRPVLEYWNLATWYPSTNRRSATLGIFRRCSRAALDAYFCFLANDGWATASHIAL